MQTGRRGATTPATVRRLTATAGLTSDCHSRRPGRAGGRAAAGRRASSNSRCSRGWRGRGGGGGGGGNNNRTTDFQSPSRAERVHNSRVQIAAFLGGDATDRGGRGRRRVHFPGSHAPSATSLQTSSVQLVASSSSECRDDIDIDGEGGGRSPFWPPVLAAAAEIKSDQPSENCEGRAKRRIGVRSAGEKRFIPSASVSRSPSASKQQKEQRRRRLSHR